MSKILELPCEVGEISDGYHTFNELYAHRNHLFLALMKSNPRYAWISKEHEDGSKFDGWFIAGLSLPTGDVSYHMPLELWDLAVDSRAKVLERGRKWDGHTPTNVVQRLAKWVKRFGPVLIR